ncbi:MAG: hypothetical protein ACPGJS_21925 [Flammeovirgaceae bacterium]
MEEQTDLEQLQQWFTKRIHRLKRKFALVQSGKKPSIEAFYTDELFMAEHGKIQLYWKANHYHYLKINQRVGDVTHRNEITVRLEPHVKSYTITAYGGFGKVSKTIQIEPVAFHDHKMPVAVIHEPKMAMKLPKLRASHSESQGKGAKFQQVNEYGIPRLNVQLPSKPESVELKQLKSELKEAFQIKEAAILEAKLADLKQTDLLDKLNDIDYNHPDEIRS